MSSNRIFFVSCALVSAVFLLSRIPYYSYYHVVILSSDSASYIAAALSILDLQLPLFDIRTPGYPLFLALVRSFSDDFIAVSLLQSVFTYIVCIFFLSVSFMYCGKNVIWFAVAITGFISSSYFIILETSILTEGIFTSLMLLTAGFFLLAVNSENKAAWILYSLAVAVMIYVRPAGLFMTGIFVPVAVWFFIKKYPAGFYSALVLPFALMMLLLCSYNYATLGKFTITPFGEANLAGVTVLFMEPSADYPEEVNSAINKTLETIPRSEKNAVRNSRNPDKLFITFRDYFHKQMDLVNNLKLQDSTMNYLKAQPYLRQISLDAISKHPGVYTKFFLVNMYYFFTNISRVMDYFSELARIYSRTILDNRFVTELEDGRWRQISHDTGLTERVKNIYSSELEKQKSIKGFHAGEDSVVTLSENIFKDIADAFQKFVNVFFRNMLWLAMFVFVSALCIFKLVKSRLQDKDAFIFLMFALMFLFKAILVSSVESSLERYSYTVEFAIYMSLPFAIILLTKSPNVKTKTKYDPVFPSAD